MLIVTAICHKDWKCAVNLYNWIAELEGELPKHKCLLIASKGMAQENINAVHAAAKRSFSKLQVISPSTENEAGWPESCNHLFRTAVRYVNSNDRQHFFWLEPDCVIVKHGAIDALEKEYTTSKKPFMGYEHDKPNRHLTGCAIYPPNLERYNPDCLKHRVNGHGVLSWDVISPELTLRHAHRTKLIQHQFWKDGIQNSEPPTFETRESLSIIKPETVVFHRNKDGTLIDRLRESRFDNGIVSLRRNGDIICLLPLLKKLSDDKGEPIKLFVHRDFSTLLEGVSYVKPEIVDGDYENPLAIAHKFNAVNAQVYGHGLNPDFRIGNFAKSSWKKIGVQWDRYLPLIFDKRSPKREKRLVKSVFKTRLPKVLLKFDSISTPFRNKEVIQKSIRDHFNGRAEIADLDFVKAVHIYDLIGLMDSAACLVTVDTSVLWLSHASKIPNIALVNERPFGASPARGNCLLRLSYPDTAKKINRILQLIELSINFSDKELLNSYIVHVFSDWTPTNPDAIRRNREALQTWHLLKARQLPFTGHRTSKQFGDERDMPFVKDMINAVFQTGKEDICIITNNDIRFDEKLREQVVSQCGKVGCWWAFRVDNPNGKTDGGADCFAMTRTWWALHEHQLPDLLFGYRWWDNILRRIMVWSGCEEQPRLYYHEPHPGVETRMQSPGEKYNQSIADTWLVENDEAGLQGYPHELQKPVVAPKKGLVEIIKSIVSPEKPATQPRVWVFAVCYNEAEMLPYFLRHYSTFAEKVIIWDEHSTDGSRELIQACPKAELRDWPFKGLDDDKFIMAVNEWTKEAIGKSDWVIFCDIDELLYHPTPLLTLAEATGDVIPSKGYALISRPDVVNKSNTHQIYDMVRTGIRQENYDKRIIWRPECEIQHTIGRHTYDNDWPKFKGQLETKVEFKLFHCHHVWGVEDTKKRNQRNFDRATNKKYAWNYTPKQEALKHRGTAAWVAEAIANNLLVDVFNGKDARKFNFGCGGNKLYGWENFDAECDISKPLPFPNESASHIFAEHVVEHVTPKEAWNFFQECFRVLKCEGTLRVAIPDVCRMWRDMTVEYQESVKRGGHGDGSASSAIHSAVFNHGHKAVWSQETLCTILTAIGFFTNPCEYGKSVDPVLQNIEGHGKAVGESVARVETSIVEARKPSKE